MRDSSDGISKDEVVRVLAILIFLFVIFAFRSRMRPEGPEFSKPEFLHAKMKNIFARTKDGKFAVVPTSSRKFDALDADNQRAAALVELKTGRIAAYYDATSGP